MDILKNVKNFLEIFDNKSLEIIESSPTTRHETIINFKSGEVNNFKKPEAQALVQYNSASGVKVIRLSSIDKIEAIEAIIKNEKCLRKTAENIYICMFFGYI